MEKVIGIRVCVSEDGDAKGTGPGRGEAHATPHLQAEWQLARRVDRCKTTAARPEWVAC